MKHKEFILYTKIALGIIMAKILNVLLPSPKSNSNSLLLINTENMGDIIVSSILLENPKIFEQYENVEFIIRDEFSELFSEYNGKVNLIGCNLFKYKYSIIYKYKFLKSIRKSKYRTCIHLSQTRKIINEDIVLLSNATVNITINSNWIYYKNKIATRYYNKYNFIVGESILNEYDKHIALICFMNDNSGNVEFNTNQTFPLLSTNYINAIIEDEYYIAIAPYPSLEFRNWHEDNWLDLIHKLTESYKIVLLGTPEQKKDLVKLQGNNKSKIVVGNFKLSQLPWVLKKCKLFIGLDSGVTHIALKLGIPLIALIGGGEYGRFFPYRESNKAKFLFTKLECFLCHWECTKSEMFCLSNVTVQDVLKEVNNLIK